MQKMIKNFVIEYAKMEVQSANIKAENTKIKISKSHRLTNHEHMETWDPHNHFFGISSSSSVSSWLRESSECNNRIVNTLEHNIDNWLKEIIDANHELSDLES